MQCRITALTRSANKKTTRKNNKQQNKQKQEFRGRNPIYKFKSTQQQRQQMQSDETLTTQI